MSHEQPVYLSYLLRLWPVSLDGDTVWRASLESALSGKRQGFAGLEDLLSFLRRRTGESSDQVRVTGDEVGDMAP
jgi:hypothetical protein